jgi:glycerol-3-phosphate acyltransferase PlsY
MTAIALLIGSYLCGSIPFGLLVGRFKGVDIRRQGSGNIGATNAGRVLGRPYGYLVFVLDLLKGLGPVLFAGMLLRGFRPPALLYLWWVAIAAASVVGHLFPVFLKFKGGKGVATSLGAVLGIYPFFTAPALGAFGVWLVLVRVTRYVSVASIGGALAFPVFFGVSALMHRERWGDFADLWPLYLMSGVIALLIVVRHRGNIRRLLDGVEPRIGQTAMPLNDPAKRS